MGNRNTNNGAELTAENVGKAYYYNPTTGQLFRRQVSGRLRPVGCPKDRDNFLVVTYNKKQISIRKIIWLLVYKRWPKGRIIAKDNNPDNNKLDNLIELDASIPRSMKSGIRGIYWNQTTAKWRVVLTTTINIGWYSSLDEAKTALTAEKEKLKKKI